MGANYTIGGRANDATELGCYLTALVVSLAQSNVGNITQITLLVTIPTNRRAIGAGAPAPLDRAQDVAQNDQL